MAEWLLVLSPIGSKILCEIKWYFIAQSPSSFPFHCFDMTEMLLKGT